LFYFKLMQESFGFASGDVADWSSRLTGWGGDPLPIKRRPPLGQLVKSIISSQTYDAVSAAAYDALEIEAAPLMLIADMPAEHIQKQIAAVTYPELKARYLIDTMRIIRAEQPDASLDFLADIPLEDALSWLERLPGVGRKVAASTLNASTLNLPVFIVDTHVLRVLSRLGFIDHYTSYRAASEAVTAAMPRWSGDDFLRLHILVKRLGQRVCRYDVPACGWCPLAGSCSTAEAGWLSKPAPSA
jgi:endonuclease-3